MARLVRLPLYHILIEEINARDCSKCQRIGQYLWNKYGQRGINNQGWPELFYADDKKALDIVNAIYYGEP
ncbi:hypothetical protein [Xanthomonas phage DES1]|nr:hypothetical protein [Xanthomonas phage DES1]